MVLLLLLLLFWCFSSAFCIFNTFMVSMNMIHHEFVREIEWDLKSDTTAANEKKNKSITQRHTSERIFMQLVYWISFFNNKSFSPFPSIRSHCPLSIGFFSHFFRFFAIKNFEWINRLSCVPLFAICYMCSSNKYSSALLYSMLNPFEMFFFSSFSKSKYNNNNRWHRIYISIRSIREFASKMPNIKVIQNYSIHTRSHTNTSYTWVCCVCVLLNEKHSTFFAFLLLLQLLLLLLVFATEV